MTKTARIGFGIANAGVALLVAWGVFRGLPTRWWVVDAGATACVVSMAASALALLADHKAKKRITRVAAAIVLVLGLAVFAALCLTASWLAGVYGPVGKGGAAIFALVAALAFPYLVVLPAVELVWVGRAMRKGA
ncbi:MAG: hypothetical protein KF819_30385 [Labilithrix sp.]|nr:hypothetical protein [Labilithrix sp.]